MTNPAVLADPPHEALREDADQRRGEQVVGSTPMSSRRVTAPAASLVWSVESTRWPVSAAWIAISRRLEVADLADHDDVRVLAQDRAQAAANVRPIFGLTWIWLMPCELVFDRVLDRDDLHARAS